MTLVCFLSSQLIISVRLHRHQRNSVQSLTGWWSERKWRMSWSSEELVPLHLHIQASILFSQNCTRERKWAVLPRAQSSGRMACHQWLRPRVLLLNLIGTNTRQGHSVTTVRWDKPKYFSHCVWKMLTNLKTGQIDPCTRLLPLTSYICGVTFDTSKRWILILKFWITNTFYCLKFSYMLIVYVSEIHPTSCPLQLLPTLLFHFKVSFSLWVLVVLSVYSWVQNNVLDHG